MRVLPNGLRKCWHEQGEKGPWRTALMGRAQRLHTAPTGAAGGTSPQAGCEEQRSCRMSPKVTHVILKQCEDPPAQLCFLQHQPTQHHLPLQSHTDSTRGPHCLSSALQKDPEQRVWRQPNSSSPRGRRSFCRGLCEAVLSSCLLTSD